MREITKKAKPGDVGVPSPIARHKPISETKPTKRELDLSLLKAVIEENIEHGLEKARSALTNGADADSKSNTLGVTALMLASYKGKFEIVELLIKNGADVNLRDEDGYTALYYATRANHKEVMAFLQEHGAKKVE